MLWLDCADGNRCYFVCLRAVRRYQTVHDSYLLVNIVDNNYVDPSADIFRIFHEVSVCTAAPS